MRSVLAGFAIAALALAQSTAVTDMKSIHKVFIDKMPNDLDQYLRAEFTKQLEG